MAWTESKDRRVAGLYEKNEPVRNEKSRLAFPKGNNNNSNAVDVNVQRCVNKFGMLPFNLQQSAITGRRNEEIVS